MEYNFQPYNNVLLNHEYIKNPFLSEFIRILVQTESKYDINKELLNKKELFFNIKYWILCNNPIIYKGVYITSSVYQELETNINEFSEFHSIAVKIKQLYLIFNTINIIEHVSMLSNADIKKHYKNTIETYNMNGSEYISKFVNLIELESKIKRINNILNSNILK